MGAHATSRWARSRAARRRASRRGERRAAGPSGGRAASAVRSEPPARGSPKRANGANRARRGSARPRLCSRERRPPSVRANNEHPSTSTYSTSVRSRRSEAFLRSSRTAPRVDLHARDANASGQPPRVSNGELSARPSTGSTPPALGASAPTLGAPSARREAGGRPAVGSPADAARFHGAARPSRAPSEAPQSRARRSRLGRARAQRRRRRTKLDCTE